MVNSSSTGNHDSSSANVLPRSTLGTVAIIAEDDDEPPSPRPAQTQDLEVASGHEGHHHHHLSNTLVNRVTPYATGGQDVYTTQYSHDEKDNDKDGDNAFVVVGGHRSRDVGDANVDEKDKSALSPFSLSFAHLRRIMSKKPSSPSDPESNDAHGSNDPTVVSSLPNHPNPSRLRALFTPVNPLGPSPTYTQSLTNILKYTPLNIFLLAIPISWSLHFLHKSPTLIFIFSALGIIPLAALLGFGTEQIALRTSHAVGGLLNATLGNIVEMIIAGIALKKCELELVQSSLLGGLLSNLLLVLGMAFVVGGWRFHQQEFQPMVAQLNSSLMTVSVISLIVPAAFHEYLGDRLPQGTELGSLLRLSRGSAIVLIFIYCAYLVFQFYSHNHLFLDVSSVSVSASTSSSTRTSLTRASTRASLGRSAPSAAASVSTLPLPTPSSSSSLTTEYLELNTSSAILLLVTITALAYLTAENLITSLHGLVSSHPSLSKEWLTLIIIPIISNAAEHTTAVVVASKGKFDLAMSVAVGSCIQIALFVIPVLVCVAWGMGKPLTLLFDEVETVVLFFSVLLVKFSVEDGKSHWMSGVVLISVYVIVALSFWNFPETVRMLQGQPLVCT